MRKPFLSETPLGVWLIPEYFCMVSPVKHCCTPIYGLNDRSVEVCCAFTFFPLLLWQMGVSQVHSVCLTFPYLSKNNKQLMFCCAIAFRQCKHFFNILNTVKQLGVCCGHLSAHGSLCVGHGSGAGCCWYNLCSCLGQPRGKRYLLLSIQETKIQFCFLHLFRCICLVQIQSTQTSAHRPFILSGSSCLASTELVRRGKAWCANQNHNWILYIWWDCCLAVVWTVVDEVVGSGG